MHISHALDSEHATFRQGLERVAASLPKDWNFSVVSATVNHKPQQGQPNVDIAIAYDRPDIARIYAIDASFVPEENDIC